MMLNYCNNPSQDEIGESGSNSPSCRVQRRLRKGKIARAEFQRVRKLQASREGGDVEGT